MTIPDAELFSAARFPVLSASGRAMLTRLARHPHAPEFRNASGHRLDRRAVWEARWRHWRLRRAVMPERASATKGPDWADAWVRQLAATVPSAHGLQDKAWHRLPTTSRADLSQALHLHVPCGLPVQRLLCFTTSGTTGHPLKVPSLPSVAADYQAYHARALAHFGVQPRARRGQVGIVLAGFQQRCFTYVSVNPLRGECGLVKLNLQPSEWRDAGDRQRYLDDLAPELVSGDPISLAELASLDLHHRPSALLSTSMALSDGLRNELELRFGCPVLDLYSLNEVGPIGVFDPAVDGYVLLQPRLHVEVVDPEGRPLPWGFMGEVTVSGGFNPCLPLLRYRTGDHARLERSSQGPVLRGLVGRAPVKFRTPSGRWINNVDVTQALSGLSLVQFALHQQADGHLVLRIHAKAPIAETSADAAACLKARFGEALPLTIETLAPADQLRQYTSDLPGSGAPW